MKYSKSIILGSQGLVAISSLALLSVSIMAFLNPKDVMALVNVQLNNNDAISSIRGVYGGVGLTIVLSLTYLLINDLNKALIFLSMLWGFYALCRLLTLLIDGELGSFGKQWLFIESILFVLSILLLVLHQKFILSNRYK
jgi:hypothetical protein